MRDGHVCRKSMNGNGFFFAISLGVFEDSSTFFILPLVTRQETHHPLAEAKHRKEKGKRVEEKEGDTQTHTHTQRERPMSNEGLRAKLYRTKKKKPPSPA